MYRCQEGEIGKFVYSELLNISFVGTYAVVQAPFLSQNNTFCHSCNQSELTRTALFNPSIMVLLMVNCQWWKHFS